MMNKHPSRTITLLHKITGFICYYCKKRWVLNNVDQLECDQSLHTIPVIKTPRHGYVSLFIWVIKILVTAEFSVETRWSFSITAISKFLLTILVFTSEILTELPFIKQYFMIISRLLSPFCFPFSQLPFAPAGVIPEDMPTCIERALINGGRVSCPDPETVKPPTRSVCFFVFIDWLFVCFIVFVWHLCWKITEFKARIFVLPRIGTHSNLQ